MRCPVCGGKVVVKDSRRTQDEVLRRRQCLSCGEQIYTIEFIDESDGVKKQLQKIHQREMQRVSERNKGS